MKKEQKFFKALQNIFIGAKIEGEGGFINLMRTKSSYYSQIEKLLKDDVNKALEKYPKFREELFDKLHSFFSRYFTESGSIYFNSTPFHNNIYEKVYTEEKDVILFWKTQMLYYVKTDRIFRSMPVEIPLNPPLSKGETRGLKFYFDAKSIENKKANEKRSLVFELKQVREDGTIIFTAAYSERGRKTKTDETLKAIKRKGIAITEEQLEQAFRVFEKQSEVDFFINKNAKAFLQEQFKLWSYQYFWEGAKEWGADRVNQLQILKDIAFKIIDFISQFEDELVKVWNKPKFVKNSNYVITLDRILSACHCEKRSAEAISLIEKILKHSGIREQIKEWQGIGIVDKNFKVKEIFETDLTGTHLVKKYEHLPIDTKYFKDLELEILALFDDLDNQLDGWLIKSENYQALNTILPKFKEKVQTIYIDPPFNLDSSDQFLYRTNYKDANWATLLENRLKLAKDILNKQGSIFVRCDYNGNWIVKCLLNQTMDINNNSREIILRKANSQGVLGNFNPANESLFFYPKNDKFIFNPINKDRNREVKWVNCLSPKENKEANKVIVKRNGYEAPKGQHWRFSQVKFDYLDSIGRLRINEKTGIPQYLESEEVSLDTNWTDVQGYSFINKFQTENAEVVLQRVIDCSSQDRSIILDFFLGSGTTTAVAHKLGRKWLGVEMGEHFYSVVLPRMKKVLAYDKSGISKEIKNYQGGGFFKYYELEQYEEALNNCKYADGDLFNKTSEKAYQDYVFMKDEKMLKALEIDYKKNKINVDLSKLYSGIDIAETLSNLTGKWIKAIRKDEVEFTDGTKIPVRQSGSGGGNTKDLDYKIIKPLIWW